MQEPAHDYRRVTYGGKTVNYRTRTMLEAAATLFGEPFRLTQGSYNKGVAASAGTHDGGGVVDISVGAMTGKRREFAVECLRRVGFFAWLRVPPAFSYHIHAVACGDKEMSSGAKGQQVQGFADRDGLARRGPDAPADPYPVWIDQYGRHVSLDRPEPDVQDPVPAPKPVKTEGKMKLVTRVGWGGPIGAPGNHAEVRKGIAVHYDGGTGKGLALKPHSACVSNVKAIHQYHLSKGWAGIGYAWLICPHGYVFEGRGFDRTQAAQPGGNSSYQSVQFMLGGDEKPNAEMYEAWYQLRDFLRSKGVAKDIKPHSHFIATTCPGTFLRARITDGKLAKATPKPAPKPVPAGKPWIWEAGPWVGDRVTNSTRIVQAALNDELKAKLVVDGKFGPKSRTAYGHWQTKLGLVGEDADGVPGPWSLRKLGAKQGFEVRKA